MTFCTACPSGCTNWVTSTSTSPSIGGHGVGDGGEAVGDDLERREHHHPVAARLSGPRQHVAVARALDRVAERRRWRDLRHQAFLLEERASDVQKLNPQRRRQVRRPVLRERGVDLVVGQPHRSGERVIVQDLGFFARDAFEPSRAFLVQSIADVGRDRRSARRS